MHLAVSDITRIVQRMCHCLQSDSAVTVSESILPMDQPRKARRAQQPTRAFCPRSVYLPDHLRGNRLKTLEVVQLRAAPPLITGLSETRGLRAFGV